MYTLCKYARFINTFNIEVVLPVPGRMNLLLVVASSDKPYSHFLQNICNKIIGKIEGKGVTGGKGVHVYSVFVGKYGVYIPHPFSSDLSKHCGIASQTRVRSRQTKVDLH